MASSIQKHCNRKTMKGATRTIKKCGTMCVQETIRPQRREGKWAAERPGRDV